MRSGLFRPALRGVAAGVSALLIAAGLTVVTQTVTAQPAAAAQNPTSCQGQVALVNGSFEQPAVGNGTYRLFPAAQVPGWQTTDVYGQIELWGTGFLGVPAGAGRQFAELNANSASRLYQDVATTPGQVLSWSLKHRGRNHSNVTGDVMRVVIGAPGGTLSPSGGNLEDGTAAWGTHTGTYTVPAGQTVTRFGFEAVTSVGGNGVGNFLDDITFGTGPCLVSTKTVTNLTRGGTGAQVGDVLRYTVTTRNDGGNPALQSVSTDVLENGIDFVPGSIRIVSGAGAGTLTDAASDDRGEFSSGDRTVRVRLGDAATAAAGGSIAVGTSTSYTFDARVNSTGADTAIDNEARVVFRDAVANQTRTSTTQTTVTPVGPAADLAVTKTLDTDPVIAGEPVSFTITAANNGPQTATGVVVTDTLPTGLTDVQVQGADCTTAGSQLTCALPDLADGETTPITVTGVAAADLDPGSALTNTASITGSRTDPNPANNTAVASGIVTTLADVSIDKTFAPDEPVAGENVTYTLTARNDGPSDARDVVITDPLDAAIEFVSASLDGEPCAWDGTTVLCAVGTLAPGETAIATVTVTLDPGAAAVVQNTATITTTTSDPDPSYNASSTGFQPEIVADLEVVKSASAAVVEAGDPISFRLDVTNRGSSNAVDVVLTDTLPVGFDIVSVDAPDGVVCDQAVVRCTWDALPNGQTDSIIINAVVRPDAPAGSVTNTASVAAPAEDIDTTNNSSSVDVAVEQSADLRIEKAAAPATGVPGTAQSFTLTVTNDGPSVARGVTVSDPLPAGFVADDPEDPCTITAGVLQCALGDLAPGATREVTVSGTLSADATGTLRNTAAVTSATPDPDEDDNTSTVDVPLAPSADVSVTKTTSTPQVLLGGELAYVVTVRNDGPSAATAVVVDEQPQAGITITDAVASVGSWAPAEARWSVGTLLPNEDATLTITGTADAEGVLSNTAVASSATPDPDEDDLVGTAQVTVSPSADLSLTKSASVDPAAVGGLITYSITVQNGGPSVATDVVMSDPLPSELINATTTDAACSVNEQVFTCSRGSLAVGASVTYSVTGTVDPATASDALVNSAAVTGATGDPDPDDNSDTVSTPIFGEPAVELVKLAGAPVDADENGRVDAGDTVAYTFTVRNTGPTVLTDAVIDDPLLGGTIECAELAGVTLTPGETISCAPVVYTLTQDDIDAGTVRNVAAVTVQSPRGPAQDEAVANIVTPMVNSVSLAKAAGAFTDVDDDGRVGAGDTVDYTFTVQNTGTTTLTDAVITDEMLGGELDCAALDGAELAPGQAVECGPITYELRQSDIDDAAVHNEAAVTAQSPEGAVNDSAEADVVVDGADAIELVKTAGAITDTDGDGRIGAGDELAYSFTVRNIGTTTLTAAAISDPLLGGDLDCPALESASLAPGATAECGPLAYELTQADIESGLVHNEAAVEATGATGSVTDAASADVVITGVSEIALTKSAGAPTDATGDGRIGAGDRVDYSFTVRNTGTTVLSDVLLVDPLLGGEVECPAFEGIALQPGDELECGPIGYELTQEDVDARTVHNEASVSGQSRLGETEGSAEADVEVIGVDAIELVKSAGAIVDANDSGAVDAGDTIAYTFAVTNTGTTTVTGLTITDPRLTGEITCEVTELAPNEMTVCAGEPAILTQAEVDAGEIVNAAIAAATGAGDTEATADASVTTPIEAQPAIALEKTGGEYADADGDRTLSAGDTVQFRFVVINTGAVTLSDIAIDDPKLGGAVSCDITALAPGESVECGPVAYAITAIEARDGTVTNAATVSAVSGALVVTAADSVTVDLPQLALTGGLITLLPWAIVLSAGGLVILLVGRARRFRAV